MTFPAAATAPYEVKSPSAVLADDVICLSFIQSSSTLAYACLLIRRGRHDLAAHVLHSLESKPASRFKDMVFYLQCQIGIETGDFAQVKRRLAPRVQQHPNDMVALSLLESCVFLEWEDWQRRNPDFSVPTLADEGSDEPPPETPVAAGDPSGEDPAYHTLPVPTVPSGAPAFPAPADSGSSPQATPIPAPPPPSAAAAQASSAQAPASARPGSSASPSGGADFGIFQPLAADSNTLALTLWDASQRKVRATAKRSDLEPLVSALPDLVPSGLREAVLSLEGGDIHKICLSFQGMTVTSLHMGSENLGLVTGSMNQSLLTMVRAENIFLKVMQSSGASKAAGAGPR